MPLESQQMSATGSAAARAGAGAPLEGRWQALAVVCLGVMMAFVNVSSLISALPAIQSDLHTSPAQLVWVSSAYTLAVVSVVLSAGTLGDLIGRRAVFLGGVAVFAVSSALAFFSDSAGLLIAAQALMGIGGAAILPASLSIVSHAFTDPRERTSAISVWASCSGLGLAIGPPVAGILLDHASWHAVFLINVVLGVVAIALTPLLVPESKHPTRRLDPAGVVLGTVVVASATYAIIEGGSVGYTAAQIVAAYVVFLVSLIAFVRIELRHHDPMLDLRLFKSPSFAVVMGVATATMFGFVGISLLSVLYLERVQHLGALATGLRMLAMFGTYIVVSAVAARLVRRVGVRAMLTGGLVIMGAGSLILLAAGASSGFGSMFPGLLIVGIGSGLLVAPSTAAAVNSVPTQQAGMASAAVNMFRQLGSVLGPSVLGTIVTTRFPHNLTDRLLDGGVPTATTRQIVDGASHGGSTAGLPASLQATVTGSAGPAFTDAVHLGLLIGGIVLLVTAVPTMAFVGKSRRS
ncbi:MFS transporter [Amycolatopsis rhabdoformis]|uniref:MFS transporter n=1 Tax=Amycolatopsis rhabdoformis TaxID=1448059 RepID=A0ABZ1HXV6_9PSEU|nr:MFS transporter [Amycolatopsis rhabdoformis]WSE26200.1 MFS transporter [Amycolatopsis rhabdoformis]